MVSETVCINIYRKKPNSIILGNVTCTNSSTTSWLQLLHQNNQFGFNEEHYEIQGLLHRRRGSAEGIVKSELSCMISKTLEKWKHISWTKVYKVHLVMKVGGTPPSDQ
ncbi:hypothetical protein Ocin01_17982 [Orchesella cincta]|uniref:Uncharacterized protein n=1 Tax=Orchesella cincta TaxID=48709 RepID=A0A1D2M6V1_ORCCI|nr:hypothetical protein Ocin01_17982 [Orchesella cincta]